MNFALGTNLTQLLRFVTTDFDHRVTSGLGELSVTPQAARPDLEQAALESDTTVQVVAPHLIRRTLSADPGGD